MTTAAEAAAEYIARRDRTARPAGRMDDARRWWPAASERCACCDDIRTPSRGWPFSLLTHCRSAEHVAALRHVDKTELKREARRLDARGAA